MATRKPRMVKKAPEPAPDPNDPFAGITVKVVRNVMILDAGNGVDIVPPPERITGPHMLVFDPQIGAWRGFRLSDKTAWHLRSDPAPSSGLVLPSGVPVASLRRPN